MWHGTEGHVGLGAGPIPDSGLSIPTLPAPERPLGPSPAAVIAHSYLSSPGEGFSPDLCAASQTHGLPGGGRKTWQGEKAGNIGKGFPLKYVKKMRGNLVHQNMGKSTHTGVLWPQDQTEHMSWER